jgi:D-lactate dehydrogenase (cytochrome)
MVIKTKKEEFQSYLEDTSNLKGSATLLYIPQEVEEISCIVRECTNRKIPFTISGGRTGTTGGCVPLEGAVISLEKLKKIKDIDKDKKIVYLEAGVSLEELEQEVNRFNLTLRASPTEGLALVGGAVSTSASGVRGFGYGSIRNYVLGIEVVLPTGEIMEIRRGEIFSKNRMFDFEYKGKKIKFLLPSYNIPKVKSQAGYFVNDNMDLIDLFIGSEGTLGIIVSCKIKLQQFPLNIFDGLVFFKKESSAFEFISSIKKLKSSNLLKPASLEFFDKRSLEMLKENYPFIPLSEAAVYFEQEVERDKDYTPLMEKWASLIESHGASLDSSILAETPEERRKVFSFRHELPQIINEFLRHHHQIKSATDIAVCWDKFLEMYSFYKEVGESSCIDYVNFGHIGESHLHFNFLPRDEEESIRAREYLKVFCQKAVNLGGTVSAEHGVGKIKKPYLKIMYTEKEIREMAHLKKYFDPYCLLSLDNIFDKELLYSL